MNRNTFNNTKPENIYGIIHHNKNSVDKGCYLKGKLIKDSRKVQPTINIRPGGHEMFGFPRTTNASTDKTIKNPASFPSQKLLSCSNC